MDTFIGGLASILFFTAAYAVICKILSELHLFIDETLIKDFAQTGFLVVVIGLFYGTFLAFMRNTSYDTTNFFDLEKVFGIQEIPNFLFLTKIFGKLLFGQTLLMGFVLAFLYSNLLIWFLKKTLELYFSASDVQNLLWLIFCLPGFILLYMPNGASFFLAAAVIFIYLILKRIRIGKEPQKTPVFLQNRGIFYSLFVLLLLCNFIWMFNHFISGGAA